MCNTFSCRKFYRLIITNSNSNKDLCLFCDTLRLCPTSLFFSPMNNVREKLKTLPSKAVTKILKRAFVLPTSAARFFVNDLTKPRKSHLPWIHKVKLDPNGPQQWHGCWIGKDVRKLSKDALLQRIHDADLILFYVHGILAYKSCFCSYNSLITIGGGFRVGSSTMYMDTTISWLKALKKKHNINTMIMSIDYR